MGLVYARDGEGIANYLDRKSSVMNVAYVLSKLVYSRLRRVRCRAQAAENLANLYSHAEAHVDAYVETRLAKLLRRAARLVPYYADMFARNGWDSERAEEYWHAWPILRQQQLQEQRQALVAGDAKGERLYLDYSGGSSGYLKSFFHSSAYAQSSAVANYLSDSVAGWYPGACVARLWGAPGDINRASKLADKARRLFNNSRIYDSFDMGEDQMMRYHRAMLRRVPEIIVAYAGSAFEFARFLERIGVSPPYPRRAIITSAETLTSQMRLKIESVFRKPVFDRYASREVGMIAFECGAHAGLHIALGHNLVEIVRPGSLRQVYEEEGDILVTTLGEPFCPLIRYQIGDVGIMTREPCLCARNTPRLIRVLGRNTDFLTASDGSLIHGEYFTHALYGMHKVRRFLMVQESLHEIDVQILAAAPLEATEENRILSAFREKLGTATAIRIRYVDEIPPLSSGKTRFTVSNMSNDGNPVNGGDDRDYMRDGTPTPESSSDCLVS